MRWSILVRLGTTIAALCLMGAAMSAEFRIETTVVIGDSAEALSRNTTLFHSAVVYDYLTLGATNSTSETTVFDPGRQRIFLLDPRHRIQSEFAREDIEKFVEWLRTHAAGDANPYLRFLAKPTFEESFDRQTGELRFESPWMTYHLETHLAPSHAVARQYGEFSHWYARLNTMTNPGALPPFARARVNEALEAHRRIPRRVDLVVTPQGSSKDERYELHSDHRVGWELTAEDLRMIDRTRRELGEFERLAPEAYARRRAPTTAAMERPPEQVTGTGRRAARR